MPDKKNNMGNMPAVKKPADGRVFLDGALRQKPANIAAEQGLLAAIILGADGLLEECQRKKVTSDFFYDTRHQYIFDAIRILDENKSSAIDEIAIGEELKRKNALELIGGMSYLNELTYQHQAVTTLNARYWLEVITEKYFLRQLIAIGTKTVETAYSSQGDVNELLNIAEKEFLALSNNHVSTDMKRIGDPAFLDVLGSLINTMYSNKGEVTGIPTGFKQLNNLTFGFHPGQMIVVAARPGMGKTSIALNFIEAALFDHIPKDKNGKSRERNILMFSLEMTAEDLAVRLLASKTGIDLRSLRSGYVKKEVLEKVYAGTNDFKLKNLYIDDAGGQTFFEMRAKARQLHKRAPLDMIVIDYLQLINGTGKTTSREQEIAEASRSIKALAKELKLPIIALAQLNRKSEDEHRPPQISDLRESGSIEQDADIVMLISRDLKKTKKTSVEEEEEDKNTPMQKRILDVAKHRNGQTMQIPLYFVGSTTRFVEPDVLNITDPND